MNLLLLVLNALLLLSTFHSSVLLAQSDYQSNLELIRGSSVRNTNHDNSQWINTPMNEIDVDSLLGPRAEYLELREGQQVNPYDAQSDKHFPDPTGGQFRVNCEFSHFAYDDPLVHPNKPGAAHLHMFWGNTDVNAYSTYDSLFNSGSGTCNGQELNRTGYWAPAVFDDDGNVRIPMRITVYYKGYGDALGRSEVYPPGAAMIASINYHTVPDNQGGYTSSIDRSFMCSDLFRGPRIPADNTIPECTIDRPFVRTLEMHVKFPNCWNGEDPSNPDNWRSGSTGWGSSVCGDWVHTPNIEYIIQYPMAGEESTDGWYLASDINPMTQQQDKASGSSVHGDWWGAWNREINQTWLDNCTNYKIEGVPTGCGLGYLSDGGPNNDEPYPGPALKRRPEYTGPIKVAASTLFNDLCNTDRELAKPQDAAYCQPMTMHNNNCDVTDPANQFELRRNSWQMLSLPCVPPSGTTVKDLFGDSIAGQYGVDWQIYTFNPANPARPYIDPELNGELAAGQGFWIIQTRDSSVTLKLPQGSTVPAMDLQPNAICLSNRGCVELNLSGLSNSNVTWNMLGSPYLSTVPIEKVRVSTDSGTCERATGCTVGQAQTEGIMGMPMFRYNGSDYERVTADSEFEPWGGYWVGELPAAAGKQPRLVIPAPPTPTP